MKDYIRAKRQWLNPRATATAYVVTDVLIDRHPDRQFMMDTIRLTIKDCTDEVSLDFNFGGNPRKKLAILRDHLNLIEEALDKQEERNREEQE